MSMKKLKVSLPDLTHSICTHSSNTHRMDEGDMEVHELQANTQTKQN